VIVTRRVILPVRYSRLGNAVTERIGQEALRLTVAHRAGKPVAAPSATLPVPQDLGRKLAGRYVIAPDEFIDLTYLEGRLYMLPTQGGGSKLELRKTGDGDDLIVDGLEGYGQK
jgi:hypothetical protein